MHVSRRPFRLPFEDDPAPPRTGLRPTLAFALVALLTVGGALLLGAHGIAAPTPCGEDPGAGCDLLK